MRAASVAGAVVLLLLAACAASPLDQSPSPSLLPSASPSATPSATDPEATAAATPTANPEPSFEVATFAVPAGSHPHDVAPAADGGIWYTAQQTGRLGWLDPATGEVREIPIGPGSAPHGVIVGPDGSAWVTDSGLNAIVRVGEDDQVDHYPLRGHQRQPQHRGVRRRRHPLVHGPGWHLRQPRSGDRRARAV